MKICFTGPASTLISSKILNGKEFPDEFHVLYFQEDEVLLCGGYLVAWRIAIGSAQCFYKKDTSRFEASNFYYHKPKLASTSERYCESKPYYLLFMYEDAHWMVQ